MDTPHLERLSNLRDLTVAGDDPDPRGWDVDHAYTAEGLRRLGSALQALVSQTRDADAQTAIDRLREIADRIQTDPQSREHARLVRDALTAAATAIGELGDAVTGNELMAIAKSIDPDQPLLSQGEQVRRFFRQSARSIEAASRG